MAKNKKSFLLYADLIHTIKKLPDKDAGELFKHILEYVNDNNPTTDNLLVDVTFEPIKQQLKRDLVEYLKTCDKNKINGSKGGRPKKEVVTDNPENPVGLLDNPNKPKKPDTDIDSDIDKEKKEKEWDTFWNGYHSVSGKRKEDKEAARKYWDKLSSKEKELATKNIQPFCNTYEDKSYCKKARTYLSDKNFNDEFGDSNGSSDLKAWYDSQGLGHIFEAYKTKQGSITWENNLTKEQAEDLRSLEINPYKLIDEVRAKKININNSLYESIKSLL